VLNWATGGGGGVKNECQMSMNSPWGRMWR
jgi:hypothetical protein